MLLHSETYGDVWLVPASRACDSAAAWRLGAVQSLDVGTGKAIHWMGAAIRVASGRMIVAHGGTIDS